MVENKIFLTFFSTIYICMVFACEKKQKFFKLNIKDHINFFMRMA